jgi:hypothetical protein
MDVRKKDKLLPMKCYVLFAGKFFFWLGGELRVGVLWKYHGLLSGTCMHLLHTVP